jgi:hypothetical protein
MPFYRVTSHSLLVEAVNPLEAAMRTYRMFDDRTPTDFQVVGPDVEIAEIHLTPEQQEKAITIAFAKLSGV